MDATATDNEYHFNYFGTLYTCKTDPFAEFYLTFCTVSLKIKYHLFD